MQFLYHPVHSMAGHWHALTMRSKVQRSNLNSEPIAKIRMDGSRHGSACRYDCTFYDSARPTDGLEALCLQVVCLYVLECIRAFSDQLAVDFSCCLCLFCA